MRSFQDIVPAMSNVYVLFSKIPFSAQYSVVKFQSFSSVVRIPRSYHCDTHYSWESGYWEKFALNITWDRQKIK